MNEEQLQQQIVALVQAALDGDEQANQQIQQIMQAAQQGDPQATQIAQMIQMVAQQMQGQQAPGQEGVGMARNGAKLDYINRLRGKCPEGYEVTYFKKGGHLCKACQKKKQKMEMGSTMPEPADAVEAFKCGRKMKKKKCETGAPIEMDKCGGQAKKKKKAACGSKLPQKYADGGVEKGITPKSAVSEPEYYKWSNPEPKKQESFDNSIPPRPSYPYKRFEMPLQPLNILPPKFRAPQQQESPIYYDTNGPVYLI